MSRAQRLLDLIQLLRDYRRPVSGAVLVEALGISLRTLYRDIEALNAQGAQIDGEPGAGEVAFTVGDAAAVEATFAAWKSAG